MLFMNKNIIKTHIEKQFVLSQSTDYFSNILFNDLCSTDSYLKLSKICGVSKYKGILSKVDSLVIIYKFYLCIGL